MGVALPQGYVKTVYETIKTDNHMGWKSCTMQEAQAAADRGVWHQQRQNCSSFSKQ